jgi:hypothetical protein
MPLGALEREVLRLLAVNRNPDSYVAGATVLNQHPASPRTSKDVDVFHDTLESLARSADLDFGTLRTAGFEVIEMGCLYLDRTGKPVCPDPAAPDFPKLTRHFGSVKGAWPRIVEN